MVRLGLVAVAAMTVAFSGCSSVQTSQRCPGGSCPSELREVADAAAREPGVLSVDHVARDYGIDAGSSGTVAVRATVRNRGARALALRLARIFVDSRVEPVDRVYVDLTPSIRTLGPARMDTTDYARPRQTRSCASPGCRRERNAFDRAWAASPGAAALDLVGTRAGHDDQGRPVLTLRLRSSAAHTPSDMSGLANGVDDFATESGLSAYAAIRVVVRYPRIVDYRFVYDVSARTLRTFAGRQ
jgi:hypothetical protein